MRRAIFVVLSGLLCPTLSYADDVCRDGEQRLQPGQPCIPATMVAYLTCLSNSGGGKIVVSTTQDASGEKKFDIKVAGQGSGVIIKAGGSVAVSQSDANHAVSNFTEQLDPTLAANCKSLAQWAQTSAQTVQQPSVATLLNGVGLDHSDINPNGWLSLGSAEACRDMCYMRKDCRAMTYVISNRSCWLKYAVPQRSVNKDETSWIK
jgi:hypothetical protein